MRIIIFIMRIVVTAVCHVCFGRTVITELNLALWQETGISEVRAKFGIMTANCARVMRAADPYKTAGVRIT